MKKMQELSSELTGFLERSGIEIVYFFGSRVEETETESSDFDIGIVFKTEKSPKEIVDMHPRLYNLFTTEFHADFEKDVDIVYLQNCSFSFQYYVIRNSVVIYEDSFYSRADYEEYVLKGYLDFQPVSEMFSNALLERG